ncbi:L,D-transpeptidase [Geomonas sp. Red69]|uniref:L,D-transpeptidase n=1 Tax=Geomonas diazotrophica TaxID=2843197 RepID=A0ABX8JMV5_9BACT|nr:MULTISPECIES: L,D-transpeptidase [Geomonas]MBU5636689.1 L,D-transpeptidase [Geomonas diazotrophica]QWV98491.1 L,D-transpeptidase [Geomonas nitrogeniifigens]QXE87674.1 L,D-transpeptidase [Geomonas nitrogeniifigens]
MRPLHILLTVLILLGATILPSSASEKIRSLCEIHYPTDYLYEWDCVKVTSKDSPYKIFGKQWQDGLRFNRMDRRHFLAGMSVKVPKHMEDIKEFNPMPPFYHDAEKEPQLILIDQNEMFLGAYEFGTLVFSAPVAVGVEEYRLRNGSYRVDAVDPVHESSLFPVEGTDRPYPMHYGLRFHVDKKDDGWTSYWIHGRDLPGYPASHGCIGLTDEEMQLAYYGEPAKPLLMDAKTLYRWAVGSRDTGRLQRLRGPAVIIMGEPQVPPDQLQPLAEPAAAPPAQVGPSGRAPGP